MSNQPGTHLTEEPQSERGEPGSRDAGDTAPEGGPTDRPSGSFDQESMHSAGPGGEDANIDQSGSTPPADTGSAVPPYDGRTTSGGVASPADERPATAATGEPTRDTDEGVDLAHQPGVTRAEDM